jgi:hypothetical protein
MPNPKVEIAFDLSANGIGNWFTLDDATKGLLDDAVYTLGGNLLQDVTSYTRAITVRRGRSRSLQRFTSAAATITLDNRTRIFDPLAGTALTPYAGQILPRKQVAVSVAGVPIFTGQVEDWNLNYDLSGDSVAESVCADGFAIIAQDTLAGSATTSQAAGARIGDVLNQLGWPVPQRAIDTGQATLIADTIPADTNGLQYLQKVEASEPGAFFVNRSGLMTFRDRSASQVWGGVTFADDGTGIPYHGIEVLYGTEELYTGSFVTRSNGTATVGTATATDATAVAAYGTNSLTVDTLLSTDTQAQDLADWLVGKYKDPTYRVNALQVILDGMTATQAGQMLGLELADVVKVVYTPNRLGSALTQFVIVDGIEHSIGLNSHQVKLTLSATDLAFVLDSDQFGVLDSNILGF